MAAFLISLSLLLFWLLVGLSIATALRPWRPLQNLLLAPALGASATVLPVIALNRAGLPVRSFAVSLAVALAAMAAVLLWRFRPVVSVKRYAPFLGLIVFSMAVTARPQFEFGFDWVSYCNDDMANYVLGAHRMADHAFGHPISAETYRNLTDFPQTLWFFHVLLNIRGGSELVLAWLLGLTGMTGHQVFMPLIVALHGGLMSAACAMVYRGPGRRRAALFTAGLLAVSGTYALGTLYQLIGQVFGLSILIACMTLMLVRYDLCGTRSVLRLGLLCALPFSALLVVYPEVLPFLVASLAAHIGLSILRRRGGLLPLVRGAAVVAAASVAAVNTYLPAVLDFLLRQGGGALQRRPGVDFLFPYYLVPSGLPNLFGFLPLSYFPSATVMSAAILGGIVMSVVLLAVVTALVRRGEPVAITCVLFAAAAALFYVIRQDFPLFKLAMYVQPSLWGCLAIALASPRLKLWLAGRRSRSLPVIAGVAIIIGCNAFSHTYYVERSRGPKDGGGGSFVEVPQASGSAIIRELSAAAAGAQTPVIVTDSVNIVLNKFASLYARGKSYTPLTGNFEINRPDAQGILARERGKVIGRQPQHAVEHAYHLAKEREDRMPRTAFAFSPETIAVFRRLPLLAPRETEMNRYTTLVSTGHQQIFNRRHTAQWRDANVVPRAMVDLRNHLVFVETSISEAYYRVSSRFISVYQLESDPFLPGTTMSGLGRHFVFQVINPSRKVRLELDLSATLTGSDEKMVPPAVVLGTERIPLDSVGRGAARLFSPPFEPRQNDGAWYFGLDLGVDGTLYRYPRDGLMGLYGTDVPIDRRRLVARGRDISLVSEDDYRRLEPPTRLTRFPQDLQHPDLEFSGIYEDGWIGEASYFYLNPGASRTVAVRGVVPTVKGRSFHTELTLLVNGQEVLRKRLGTGDFNLAAQCQPVPGRNRVEVRFSNAQRLDPDVRMAAARLSFVGFEPDHQRSVTTGTRVR